MFDKYNNKNNPKNNLWQFDSYFQIWPEHKNLVAKFFKSTLTMNAVAWYKNLPNDSINSWEKFKKAFLAH